MLNYLRLNPSNIFNNDFQDHTLKNTAIQGSLALFVSQTMSFGLSMLNAIILARLLTPSDFGIVGMVTVFINFLRMFKDAGLASATIQKDIITRNQISTLFWINSFISLILGIIILISSPFIATFYKQPELTAVTAVLAISFILEGLGIQHSALLTRHMKFKTLALLEIIGLLSQIIVAVLLAFLGFGYWSLVISSLARTFINLILVFYSCPWIPVIFKRGTGVRDMMKFGGNITGSYFIGYLGRNLDQLLIGRFIGASALGLYSKAYGLLMQPLSQIKAPLTNLSFPILSALKDNPSRYRNYFSKILDISISVALPISVYCFLEGEFLILLLLGQQWMGAVSVFKILSAGGVFIALSSTPGMVMLSHGFSKRHLKLSVLNSLITSVSFIAGLSFGIKGIAFGYTFANILIMVPSIYFGFKDTPISMRLIFNTMIGPIFSSLMAGIIFSLIKPAINNVSMHFLAGSLYLLIYVSMTMLRPRTRETIKDIWNSMVVKQNKITH